MMLIDNKVITAAKKIKIFFSGVDGTLTDGCTYYSKDGEELKKFSHRDGRGVYLLRQNNIKFGIITSENTEIVSRRAEKLNADYCFLGVDDKLSLLESFCSEQGLSFEEIAFIGDDTNDLDIIKNVGLSFAVADATPEIVASANYICYRNGGNGAFREAVDYVIEIKKKQLLISNDN